MKKSIILLLILFLISISVEAQQPIPITSLARSSNALMTIQTNANRYQSYQYFTTAWGDTLLNFMQANPNWLGTYLPAGAVNIAAAGNNLQFTQGGTFRWTGDTTSLGEWIPQFTVSPLLSGGLINQRLIGVGSLADKYIGTSGQDNIGLYVDGYPDIYLRNQQIQDTSLAAGNYYPFIDELGKVTFGQSGIFAVVDSQQLVDAFKFYRDSLNSQIGWGKITDLSYPSGNGYDYGLMYTDNTWFLENSYRDGNSYSMLEVNGDYSVIYSGEIGTGLPTSSLSVETGRVYSNITSRNTANTLQTYSYGWTELDQDSMNIAVLKSYQSTIGGANGRSYYAGIIRNIRSNNGGILNPYAPNSFQSFLIQKDSTNNSGGKSFVFNYLDVSMENTTGNNIRLYEKYRLSNSQPTVTNGVKSLHTWTGDGSTTTPAMETMPFLFQYASFEVTGTNDAYTGQEPIHGWNQIGTSGVTGNITIQGDTMFQFPTAGVYEVEFNLVLYSLATQSDFTLSINNVTDVTGFGTGSMEGQTQLNGGLEFTVKYILTATSSSAQFTQDLLGTGVGTIVRTGSRCNIKRLY